MFLEGLNVDETDFFDFFYKAEFSLILEESYVWKKRIIDKTFRF